MIQRISNSHSHSIRKHWVILGGTVVLIIILLDLAAGQLFIRKKREQYIRTSHPFYHHGLKENRHAVEPWSATRQYEMYTNSLGFRDRTIRTVPLRADKRRIVIIGDSFVEGVEIPYDETFVGLVEKGLGAGEEVLNAGVISYSAIPYYYKTEYLLNHVGLTFDELIVFSDISDVLNDYALEIMQKFTARKETPSLVRACTAVDNFLNERSFTWWSVKTIHGYWKYHRYEQESPWWTLDDDIFGRWGKAGLDISGRYMQKLADLCRSRGIRMTIVVYPWREQIANKDLNSRQVAYWSEFAKRNNIAFINMFPLFINEFPPEQIISQYFLPDDGHWNREGHALVAGQILKHLQPATY